MGAEGEPRRPRGPGDPMGRDAESSAEPRGVTMMDLVAMVLGFALAFALLLGAA